jgi:hypothetical protein
MLLINNDLTALVFLGSEFMVSKVSLEHATDRNSERSYHPECEQTGRLRIL